MIKIEDKSKCCGCTACASKCPKDAIEMIEDENGFKYPVINEEKCVNCGLCEKVCPILTNKKISNKPKAYACINKDEEIRKDSSSGGVFSLLAEYVLENNGVVFGAAFDEEFKLKHICIDSKEDLFKLRTSKYLQSYIGDTYKEAQRFLESGKIVLFTGTPCQIEGLKSFLVKDYDNLYTQDIICHGVPSPKVWNKYKEHRRKIDNDMPKEINFRNKDNGWHKFNLKFTYNNKSYSKNQNEDIYMRCFLSNLCLRDSCYNCSFKKYNRLSDITLADYWGVEHIHPEIDDNKGISLVIINSSKGDKLFEAIKNKCNIKETDIDQAIKYNQSFICSVRNNKNRNNFFEELDTNEFDKLIKKYVKQPNIIKKVLRKVKIIAKKVLKK